MAGLTWERLGLVLAVGMLVSAAIWVITNWLKARIAREPAASHFARLFPPALGVALGVALFPATLQITGVTGELDYSAPHVVAAVVAGLVGGMGARLSYDTTQFLRDLIPRLFDRRLS